MRRSWPKMVFSLHELEEEIRVSKEANDNLEDAGNELIPTEKEVIEFLLSFFLLNWERFMSF